MKSLLRAILTIPFILPPIVVLIGFMAAFGYNSWINQVWERITGNLLIDIFNSYEGIILAHVFYNIPVIIRLTEIGWKNIDPEIIAVAKSLNASRWYIFWRIQLPQLFPTLAAASLLVFIYAFNSFSMVLILGGGLQYQTIEVRIYNFANGLDYNGAAVLTLVQILSNIIVILLYLHYSNKYEIPVSKLSWVEEKPLYQSLMNSRSLIRLSSVVAYFAFVGIVCLLPILGVFIDSFVTSDGSFTLSNYEKLFDYNFTRYLGLSPQAMINNTLIFGVAVMILASVLSLLLNHGLHYETTYRGTPKLSVTQSISGIIVILPLMVSSVTLAFALFSLYHFTPLYENTALVIIIGQTLVAFPFANRIIAAARAEIDPTIVNVARSLGASRLRTFLKIELPLLLPGIIVAGLFSFAISVGEFGATNFLARAEYATIPIGIYSLIDRRKTGPAAAFAAVLVILTAISFLIIERLGRLEFRF
jgi:thiamine transport system permease protein